MKRIIAICFSLVLGAAPVWAGLSHKYAAWPDGPVQLLLTSQERAAYQQLTTDEQAKSFIDLFWAKRDPNLETRANEFKLDFDARVAAADKLFGEKDTRGALTDRGRVFILMGPASRTKESIERFLTGLYGRGRQDKDFKSAPIGSTSSSTVMYGISFDRYKGVADIWLYSREQIPAEVHLPKRMKSVMFAFFDTDGTGHYELQRRLRDAKYAQAALEAMASKDLVHPELTELPTYPLLPGTTAATDAQLAWLSQEPAPWPDGAASGVSQGVTAANVYPAWVYVLLPEKTAAADLMVGRLTGANGKVEGTFQKAVTGIDTSSGRLYELAVPAAPGRYTLELALAAQGAPVAVRRMPVKLDEVPAGATFISPMVAGAQVIDLTEFTAGTPFIYGGHHVVPRMDGHYDYNENLSYFCLIANPGMGEDGNPSLKVRLKLYYGAQQISSQPYRSVQPSQVEPGVYMFGSQLPLSILPKAGEYTLRVTVKDAVNNVSADTRIPIIMPEKTK